MEKPVKKIKWRLNLFDIVIICVVLAALFLVFRMNNSGGGIVSSGTQETVRYTIELNGMVGDTAYSVKPGDALTDKVERRAIGSVASVEVTPFYASRLNSYTGEYVIAEYPEDKKTAVIVVEAPATVTEDKISVNGFAVRVGTEISVMGPLYAGSGYIIDIERSDAS